MIQINQDTNIFVSELEAGRQIRAEQLSNRMLYFVCLEGSLRVNDLSLQEGDALKIWEEATLEMLAIEDCHSIIVEIPGSD